MRYRFNFVIDGKCADHPNGAEFNDIVEGGVEAIAAARHMMGDWLRHQSGPLPEWLVKIVDANDAVVEVLSADSLVYPEQRRARHRRLFQLRASSIPDAGSRLWYFRRQPGVPDGNTDRPFGHQPLPRL